MNIPDRYIDYALNKIWDAAKERDQGKRKKYNGYKDKPNRTCFYRETGGAERHEVFYGTAEREISIMYGFQVDLAPELHWEIHHETEWGQKEDMLWRQAYQTVYMDCLEADGLSREEALAAWMILMSRNYLEDVVPE